MLQKLKSFLLNDAFFFSALLVLVAGASFGLGRESVIERSGKASSENKSNVVVTPAAPAVPPPTQNPTNPTPESLIPTPVTPQSGAVADSVGGEVVASKSGTKYHLPTCAGAKSIKPENLITFSSRTEAEAAGYTSAANCKGLQ